MAYAIPWGGKRISKRTSVAAGKEREKLGYGVTYHSTNGKLCRQVTNVGEKYSARLQGSNRVGYYYNIPNVPTGVVYERSGKWHAYFSGVGKPKGYEFATGLQAMRWVHSIAHNIASGAMLYPNADLGTWVSGWNGP